MTLLLGKLVWLAGVIGWFLIRYPYQRMSRKTAKASRYVDIREFAIMAVSASGLGIVPALFVFAGFPASADYAIRPVLIAIGTAIFAIALWLFYRTHKDLGRHWSVTLEMRSEHKLVTNGVYNSVRHPMYSAFWLWAVAQAFLLPNWVAGCAGLIGFGTLFFLRVNREEKMMTDTFGDEYRVYMQRTARVIPGIY